MWVIVNALVIAYFMMIMKHDYDKAWEGVFNLLFITDIQVIDRLFYYERIKERKNVLLLEHLTNSIESVLTMLCLFACARLLVILMR